MKSNKHSMDSQVIPFTERPIFTALFTTGLIMFVILVSLAFFLDLSLRLDEAQSLWQTRMSFTGIINTIAQDVHVPLYHTLLHIWQVFFGNDVTTARILSLIFFTLNIPAIYLLGKISYNRSIGLFAMLLIAVSPFMNWYGNEIRMYSLFSLITILNYFFFIAIYKKRTNWAWIGYTITAILGIYTHYFFFFALVAQVIYYFSYKNIFPEGSLKRFSLAALIVAASFLPWVLYVINQGSASEMSPLLSAPAPINIFNTFSHFLFGFQVDSINTLIVSLWPLSLLFVFWGLRKDKRISPESIFFILAIIVPMGIAFIGSFLFRPLFLARYLIFALPPLFLILSAIIYTYPQRLSSSLQVALVSLMLVTLGIQGYSAQTPVKEDYRAATNYLNAEAGPRDLIVVSAPFTIYPVDYYYKGLGTIETLPRWDRLEANPIPPFNAEKLPETVASISEDHERLFLLLSYDQGYEEEVKGYFDNNYERLEERDISPGVSVYVYKLNYE